MADVRAEVADIVSIAGNERTISVADVSGALEASRHTSLAGGRVIIIEEAAKLTLPAANALLKVLEEPPSATRWLLATRWPRRLVPTIMSRCELLRLPHSAKFRQAKPQEGSKEARVLDASLLQRLANHKEKPLTEDELTDIAQSLATILKQHGPSPELQRAFMRLRDYHFIQAQRGNAKLAQDVLLASLPEHDYSE